jgi:hypothetical protein
MSVKWKAKAHFIQNVPGGARAGFKLSFDRKQEDG